MHQYQTNDTIYFESNLNGVDTMLITQYDTTEHCGQGLMAYRRKDFNYSIKHLPVNHWIGGTEHSQNGKMNILDQDLLVVSKCFDPKGKTDFSVYIDYREFSGEVSNINDVQTNEKFPELPLDQYWVIEKSNHYADAELADSIIHRVYWSSKYGLTGYEYGTGELYRVKL